MEKRRFDAVKLTVLVIAAVALAVAVMTGIDILKSSPEAQLRAQTRYTLRETPEPDDSTPPTPTPKPTPPPREYEDSGSIYSAEGKLSLRTDWHLESVSDTEMRLDLEVYLCCYSINIGERNGVIRVCGREYPFISEEQTAGESDWKHDSLLYELTVNVPVPSGETVALPISANWDYFGHYGGKDYETITAEATLTVRG